MCLLFSGHHFQVFTMVSASGLQLACPTLFAVLWLVAGAGLLWEKNIAGWLLAGAGLMWEKNTVDWMQWTEWEWLVVTVTGYSLRPGVWDLHITTRVCFRHCQEHCFLEHVCRGTRRWSLAAGFSERRADGSSGSHDARLAADESIASSGKASKLTAKACRPCSIKKGIIPY